MTLELHPPGLPDATASEPPNPAAIQEVITELTRMIAHELDLRIEEASISPTAPLLDGGLMLDSMVLFEFIALIEVRYGVTFSIAALNSRNFGSLTVLARQILLMRAEKGLT
jgi:acyl carrier protein